MCEVIVCESLLLLPEVYSAESKLLHVQSELKKLMDTNKLQGQMKSLCAITLEKVKEAFLICMWMYAQFVMHAFAMCTFQSARPATSITRSTKRTRCQMAVLGLVDLVVLACWFSCNYILCHLVRIFLLLHLNCMFILLQVPSQLHSSPTCWRRTTTQSSNGHPRRKIAGKLSKALRESACEWHLGESLRKLCQAWSFMIFPLVIHTAWWSTLLTFLFPIAKKRLMGNVQCMRVVKFVCVCCVCVCDGLMIHLGGVCWLGGLGGVCWACVVAMVWWMLFKLSCSLKHLGGDVGR